MATVPPPLRTTEPPEPTPAPAPRVPGSGYTHCDFCGCKLAANGQIVEVSEVAAGYRDAKENHRKAIAKLDEEITNLREQLSAKDAELATLKGQASTTRSKKFL